jgi:hypothetical protein
VALYLELFPDLEYVVDEQVARRHVFGTHFGTQSSSH